MDQNQIKAFLKNHEAKKERTIVIVDFGNVEKWKHSLGWQIGIQELANLIRNFSTGKRFLRRFYYGSDYGQKESNREMIPWSKGIIDRAQMNGLEIVTKRVKYIHSADNVHGFEKKCDLDVEMAVDLIQEKDNYDTVILFSGDGDLMYAINYLNRTFGKECVVMGVRDHIGREVIDAKTSGTVKNILFAEDFEYRLNMHRGRRR